MTYPVEGVDRHLGVDCILRDVLVRHGGLHHCFQLLVVHLGGARQGAFRSAPRLVLGEGHGHVVAGEGRFVEPGHVCAGRHTQGTQEALVGIVNGTVIHQLQAKSHTGVNTRRKPWWAL